MYITDFLRSSGKKIIITDRISNVNKVMRQEVINGSPAIYNCTAMTIGMIAKELLDSYQSIYEPDNSYRVIDLNEQKIIMSVLLGRKEYGFLPDEVKGSKVSAEILKCINQIRMNEATEAFKDSTDQKITELKDIIASYEKYLEDNGLIDYPMLLNKCSMYLETIRKMKDSKILLDYMLIWISGATLSITEDMKLSFLEQKFIDSLIDIEGTSLEKLSYRFFDLSEKNTTFVRSYGVLGEVSHIVEDIVKKKISYGDVAIVYTSTAYEGFLRRELENNGMEYSFPAGIKALSGDFVSLILSVLDFASEDYEYKKIRDIVENPVFYLKNGHGARRCYRKTISGGIGYGIKRYQDYISRYRLECEEKRTQNAENVSEQGVYDNSVDMDAYIEFLERLIAVFNISKPTTYEELYTSLIKFVFDYSLPMDFDRKALYEELLNHGIVYRYLSADMIDNDTKLQKAILIFRDYFENIRLKTGDESDKIVLLPYGQMRYIDRKHLYVVGLSNENIASTLKQSPILTDEELGKYIKGSIDYALLANAKRREAFELSVKSFAGDNITLSYSSFDTVGLNENSPALLYMDMLDKAQKVKADIISVTSYEKADSGIKISVSDFTDYWRMEGEEGETCDDVIREKTADSINNFSATSIQVLLSCPLRYYYEYTEHLPKYEDIERRPDTWLTASLKGNVVHHVMDKYVNSVIIDEKSTGFDENTFNLIFDEEINIAISLQPFTSKDVMEEEKEECYDALRGCIGKLHEELSTPVNVESADTSQGLQNSSPVRKQVIGCEIAFKDLIYNGGRIVKTNDSTESEANNEINDSSCKVVSDLDYRYSISLNGSADRVDGYVDNNSILHLQIVDYKTGRMDNKRKEIAEDIQIQHYIYAYAMLDWYEKNHNKLEEQFDCKIESCVIDPVKYIFPFDDNSEITEVVEADKDGNIRLPEFVDDILMQTEGKIVKDNPLRREDFIDYFVSNKVVAEKKDDKGKLKKEADMCKYCKYKAVCRHYYDMP